MNTKLAKDFLHWLADMNGQGNPVWQVMIPYHQRASEPGFWWGVGSSRKEYTTESLKPLVDEWSGGKQAMTLEKDVAEIAEAAYFLVMSGEWFKIQQE